MSNLHWLTEEVDPGSLFRSADGIRIHSRTQASVTINEPIDRSHDDDGSTHYRQSLEQTEVVGFV